MEYKPILKCKKVYDGPDTFADITITEYAWPKGGKGVCPECGAELVGIGKDWSCETCGAKYYGPIF